jgi:hypothetical protein
MAPNQFPHKPNMSAQKQAMLYHNRKRQKARAEVTSGSGNGMRGQNLLPVVSMNVRLTIA